MITECAIALFVIEISNSPALMGAIAFFVLFFGSLLFGFVLPRYLVS